MRALTLHEKISIKGQLASKGVLSGILVRLDMATAMDTFWRCVGKPCAYHSNLKLWRQRTSATLNVDRRA